MKLLNADHGNRSNGIDYLVSTQFYVPDWRLEIGSFSSPSASLSMIGKRWRRYFASIPESTTLQAYGGG